MKTRLFNRQPVYDRSLRVIGYEIVSEKFCDGDSQTAMDLCGHQVVNELAPVDIDSLASDGRLFLNSTPQLFMEDDWKLPPEKSVLQVPLLPNAGDPDLLASLKMIREKKHQIALIGINSSNVSEYVKMADMLKINVAFSALSDLELCVDGLRKYKAKLLAHGIDTRQRYRLCHDMGFDYFQGFFCCQPVELPRRSLPVGQAVMMRLLARLQDPGAELKALEKIISRDAALCFRLLRFMNSPGLGLTRKVDTLSRAVNFLGLEPLKRWCSVILLARIEGKPMELMKMSLTRAKMCQALAEIKGDANGSSCFMAGLLSLLPAYMDRPMEDIVNELPLADDIAEGLVEGQGRIGAVLRHVVEYERGSWENLDLSSFDRSELRSTYLDAIKFTEESMRYLS